MYLPVVRLKMWSRRRRQRTREAVILLGAAAHSWGCSICYKSGGWQQHFISHTSLWGSFAQQLGFKLGGLQHLSLSLSLVFVSTPHSQCISMSASLFCLPEYLTFCPIFCFLVQVEQALSLLWLNVCCLSQSSICFFLWIGLCEKAQKCAKRNPM